MRTPQYQTFRGTRGGSNSKAKLKSLQLPGRLDGKSVLDLGCNEGYFCQEAWRRGAERVVGIDKHPEFIARARRRDQRTEYRQMDWSELDVLDESFDVVLLLSALHYARDPELLLREAFQLVNADGMLIVECGVAPGRKPEWVRVERPAGDVVRHPTRSMMMTTSALSAGVVRELGSSVDQRGDPMPRVVFRVTARKPAVLLVAGPSGSGKSTLARSLRSKSVGMVSLDHLLLNLEEWCADERLLALRESRAFAHGRIDEVSELMAAEALADSFAEAVLARLERRLSRCQAMIIEGYALGCEGVASAFADRLTEAGAYVWHVQAAQDRPPPFKSRKRLNAVERARSRLASISR